jgi:hypothetical protein
MGGFSFDFGSNNAFGTPPIFPSGGQTTTQTKPIPATSSVGLPPLQDPVTGDTNWLNTIFDFASLGTSTYLANQAITSPRPASITTGPNGLFNAAGGGAGSALGGLGSNSILGTSAIWLFLIGAVFFILLLKK